MKKTCLLVALLMCLFFSSASILNAENWYIGGNVAATFLNDSDVDNGVSGKAEFDTGYGFTGVVGHNFNPWRLEGEIAYRNNDYDKVGVDGAQKVNVSGSYKSLGFLLNGYYDFILNESVSPFLKAGVGGARLDTDAVRGGGISIPDDDEWVFAYQLGLGLGWKATKALTVDLSYCFYGTSKPKFQGLDMEYYTHNILLGIRYNF